MKHRELQAVVHNVADSLGSGMGFLIGIYTTDVFGEAARSPGGFLTVDFLGGALAEGECSPSLARAIELYRGVLEDLCTKAGGSIGEIREASVRYWSDHVDRYFTVTIQDMRGRRSVVEYAGNPARRLKVMDQLGRLRPKTSPVEG